jgi:hypothetical protein
MGRPGYRILLVLAFTSWSGILIIMKRTAVHVPKLKPNFIPWNRKWVTVRRHLPIVLKPLIAGLVLMAAWRLWLYPNGMHFGKESVEPIMLVVLPLVGFMYVIFASVAVGSVFDQYKKVSKCVVRKDLDSFLLYRDEQLPIMMHILVGAPSIILAAFVMLLDYSHDTLGGMAGVFAVTFMLVLVWVITTELDDFSKSIWFREKIPTKWYEIDIEKHFNKK